MDETFDEIREAKEFNSTVKMKDQTQTNKHFIRVKTIATVLWSGLGLTKLMMEVAKVLHILVLQIILLNDVE